MLVIEVWRVILRDMNASEQLRIAAKRARERKNLRQEDVAELLRQAGTNITANGYAKFEGGTRAGKFDEVAAIAQVLELDLTGITRSVKRDVTGWAGRTARRRYEQAERSLERAKQKFAEAAQSLTATDDLKRALAGEVIHVRLNAVDFARASLIDMAKTSPIDVAEFFDDLGDEGRFRSAAEGWDTRNPADSPTSTDDDLVEAIADALRRTVPGLRFPDE